MLIELFLDELLGSDSFSVFDLDEINAVWL